MLDDHERRALAEIEGQLLVDDAPWVFGFDSIPRRVRRQRRFALVAHGMAIALSVLLAGVTVLANAPGPTIFFLGVGLLLAWSTQRLPKPG